jgi:hypothetical protein
MRDLDEQSQRYGNPSLAHIRLRAHLPPGSPVLAEALAALALWRAGL